MSTAKKTPKSPEELQAALQKLIAQGRKEGMIRDSELRAHLEEMDLTPEKIEEIYDNFEAMNIQIVGEDLARRTSPHSCRGYIPASGCRRHGG